MQGFMVDLVCQKVNSAASVKTGSKVGPLRLELYYDSDSVQSVAILGLVRYLVVARTVDAPPQRRQFR